VLENCSGAFLKEFADFDVDGFLGCTVSDTIRQANAGSSSPGIQIETPATLDTCLIENDCIGFDDMTLDVPGLKNCITSGAFASGF